MWPQCSTSLLTFLKNWQNKIVWSPGATIYIWCTICATKCDNIDRLKALKSRFRNIVDAVPLFISRRRFYVLVPSSKTYKSIYETYFYFSPIFLCRDERKELTLHATRARVAMLSNFITGTPTWEIPFRWLFASHLVSLSIAQVHF